MLLQSGLRVVSLAVNEVRWGFACHFPIAGLFSSKSQLHFIAKPRSLFAFCLGNADIGTQRYLFDMGTEPSYAEYPQHFYDAEDASSYVQASHVRPGPGSDPDCLSVASPMFQASRSSNFHDSSPFPPNTSHPSNGEMPNRSYVRRASCGTSNVNDITHSSASPSASRPVSTFSNQNRRASSTQPSEQSSAEENSHTLTVYRRTPEGSRPLPQIPVNPALLRNLPGIYAYIREDRRQGKYSTSVTAEKPVAGEALNSMIDITLRGTQLQPKPSFGQFVDLAIACWYCKIPISPIQRWADEFQNDLQRYGFSNRTLNHFHSWMFLALIFVWPEVFRSTSKVLISQYTIRDDGMEQRRFLPERLEGRYINFRLTTRPSPTPAHSHSSCHPGQASRSVIENL